MSGPPTILEQAAAELRQAWRDFSDGLRTNAAQIGDEGRSLLRDLDAPDVQRAGFWRRLWRGFRKQTPLPLQIFLAVALFAFWVYVVWRFYLLHVFTPGPSPPPNTDTVQVT